MKWNDELADDWDDVSADPPQPTRDAVDMAWVEDGFVLTPAAAEGDVARQATSLFSTVACKVGNDPADRQHGPPEPPTEEATDGTGSPEA